MRFMVTVTFLVLACVLSDIALARASDASPPLTVADTPSWVKPAGIDTHSAFPSDTVLFDTQIKIEDESYTLFRRHAMRLGPGQFRNSTPPFSLTVNPDKEYLTLHSVVLWRNGVPHDITDAVRLRVINTAHGPSHQAIKSIAGKIEGAEPGDILDWSASWQVRTPDWPGHFYHEFYTDWAVASLHDRTRILTSTDHPLTVQTRGSAHKPTITDRDGTREYLWERREVEPTPFVHASPSDAYVYGSVSVSNSAAWEEIAAWGAMRYQPHTVFSGPIGEALGDHRRQPLGARITWAIRTVQDTLPYDDDRQGLSTHIPRTPLETLRAGRGDCKDKALLLASLLQAMDVQAVVALTDVDEGRTLPDRAPSAFAFDHAIVKISALGSDYYIDPTKSLQGGVFPNIAAPDLGYALPLQKGATLEPIGIRPKAGPETKIDETYDFSQVTTPYPTLSVTTVRRGAAADAFRHILQEESEATLAARYADWYGNLYTSLRPLDGLSVRDDRDRNIITVVERYELPPALPSTWQPGQFPLTAEAASIGVLDLIEAGRAVPLSLEDVPNIEHRIRLRGAPNAKLALSDLRYDGDALMVRRSVTPLPDGVEIIHRVQPKKAAASGDEATRMVKALSHYNRGLRFSANIDLPQANLSPRQQVAFATPSMP